MRVARFSDAVSFLALTQGWLMQAELENNVILSLAGAIADGSLVTKEPTYLAAAFDGEAIVACALRTTPRKLVVSSGPEAAIRALVADAHAVAATLPAVMGPEPAVGWFASAWCALAQCRAQVGTRHRNHVIYTVAQDLAMAPGALRNVAAPERSRALEWAQAFGDEAMAGEKMDRDEVVDRYMLSNRLFFWDDGGPVAMLAVGGRTQNGARVSLVYTPHERRGRGYATSAVATLTARLLAAGDRHCCIYTDLANPVSNSIYRRVGYRPVCDICDYVFTPS
jgi:predicted GNAT family acetyltransferase